MKVYQQITTHPGFTADNLQLLPAYVLKKWSRAWGGKGYEVKAECIKTLTTALGNPQRIKERLHRLPPIDIAALGIMKEHGGIIQARMLEQILRGYGYHPPSRIATFSFFEQCEYAPHLIASGLVLWEKNGVYYPEYTWGVVADTLIWTDARILAQIAPIAIHPLSVSLTQAVDDAATWRRSSHVLMDCMGIIRAMQEMQGLRLTETHKVFKADKRNLTKAAGWEDSFDGYTYEGIVDTLISVWQCAGWLEEKDGRLQSTITLDYFHKHAEPEIISRLMSGFMYGSHDLTELNVANHEQALYQVFLYGLRALPDLSQSYSVTDFIEAVYERMGVYAEPAGDFRIAPYQTLKMNSQEYEEKMNGWRTAYRAAWLGTASALCHQLLTGWLYWLGIVALQTSSSDQLLFRVTDLGRRVLAYDGEQAELKVNPAAQASAWIIQPNFDVILYVDNVSPAQLAFMEVHGERQKVHTHTAQYLLTRASIHRGLESGSTIDDVMTTLRTGAKADLPQNVTREIQAWAQLREQIVIHPSGRLVAFNTRQERDQALQEGLQGRPLGEVYVLAPPSIPLPTLFRGVFDPKQVTIITKDYKEPPLHNLELSEEGVVQVKKSTVDLLLDGQLARCTVLRDQDTRVLTAASLKAAKQAGVTALAFMTFLNARAISRVPPLLELMIENTLDGYTHADGIPAYVLRVVSDHVYTTLVSSQRLAPLIFDTLKPDIILVKMEHVTEFLQILKEIGVRLSEYDPSHRSFLRFLEDATRT